MHVRVCRECGEEYRPDIAVCADCGGALADRWEDEHGRPIPGLEGTEPTGSAEPAEPPEPDVPAHAMYAGAPGDMKPLADTLVAAGVPFQLVAEERVMRGRSNGARVVLLVPEPDGERARQALAPFAGRATELGLSELSLAWSSGPADDQVTCPACGAIAAADAAACPECELDWTWREAEPPAADDE